MLPEIISKLFQRLIEAHEYFPTRSMSPKYMISSEVCVNDAKLVYLLSSVLQRTTMCTDALVLFREHVEPKRSGLTLPIFFLMRDCDRRCQYREASLDRTERTALSRDQVHGKRQLIMDDAETTKLLLLARSFNPV